MSDLPEQIPSDEELYQALHADPMLSHLGDLRNYVVKNARWNLRLIVAHGIRRRVDLSIVDASLRTLADYSVGIPRNDTVQTVQHLSTRLFNSAAAALSLLLEGYYQCSIALQRDVLETGFLLDYFRHSPSLATEWANADRRKRMDDFGPASIRKALKAFDGVNREPTYTAFCEHAAHPTPLVALSTKGHARIVGPAFDQRKLFGCLGELARNVPYFTVVVGNTVKDDLPALQRDFDDYLNLLRKWVKECTGLTLSSFNDDEMKAWARQLWARPSSSKT
jgi:hypothetical protein